MGKAKIEILDDRVSITREVVSKDEQGADCVTCDRWDFVDPAHAEKQRAEFDADVTPSDRAKLDEIKGRLKL